MNEIVGPASCTPQELGDMIAIVDAAMREGTGQSLLTDCPLVYHPDNLRNIQIIKVGGQVVSVVPFIPHNFLAHGCRFRIGIISPTATHPEHRKRGYALRCLQRCLQMMEQDRIDLTVLWTEIPTFAFYQHAEFQAVKAQHESVELSRDDAAILADHGETVSELDPRHAEVELEAIRRLHKQEPELGVQRPPANYRPLFSLPRMKTLLARRGPDIVGYLLFSRTINKPGIIEAGGDELAVQTLLRHVLLSLTPGEAIQASINISPQVLRRVLDRVAPLSDRPRGSPGGHQMIRINEVDKFITRIAPAIGDHTASELRASNLSRRQLTSILFGAHPEMPVQVSRHFKFDALPLSVWMLDHS